ncbi:ABC transporter ATP-binding protein [Actinospica robiniae]|uniref:ABC transporter ATP-binding protein n=1 Tax=Actinospica robiniae TaxID=304901 RepID=UPI0004051B50|nr:ABC transporter ATP-binding protein [Actinospica robiniae]
MRETTHETVIEARDVSFTYRPGRRSTKGAYTAVQGLGLTVRRGELYALLGTNGAGKTTTLEVLEGHRVPSSGRVRVLDGDPSDRRHVRPRMGIMLQESGLVAELTVRESVALAGAVSGRPDAVDAVLDRVGLTAKKQTRVAQLSGGEKRRVDFAMAVWGSPELVFLDEPTTGLDPASRDALWAVVDDLRTSGTTFLLTTHYLEEAEHHADRVGLMHAGTLHREGTVSDLTANSVTTIRFVPPCAVDDIPIPVSGTENGLVVIRTRTVQRDVRTLTAWADAHDYELARFAVHESGLDDVFRALGSERTTA